MKLENKEELSDHVYQRNLWLSVDRYSQLAPQSTTQIDIRLTLHQHVIASLIDTWLTLDQLSVNSWTSVNQLLHWSKMSWFWTSCQPRCQLSVNQVATKVLMECWWSVDIVLMEYWSKAYWGWVKGLIEGISINTWPQMPLADIMIQTLYVYVVPPKLRWISQLNNRQDV